MATVKTYQSTSYVGIGGIAPIYAYFYINREKIVIPCNLSTKVEYYDKNTGLIKKGDKEHKDKNLIVSNILSRINEVMVRFRLRNRKLTKELFMSEFSRPDKFATFFDFITNYQTTHPRELEDTTLQSHAVVIKKLRSYAPFLHFDQISEDFINGYKFHMKKVLKNCEGTSNKNLATIKKYVRAAMKAGYIDGNPFEEIRIKRTAKSKDIVYLTEEELTTLIGLYSEKTLRELDQKILQFFLFQCFTSLHITDARKLKIEQISQKSFTYFRFKNRNSKPDPIMVPLSTPAKHLINQIKGMKSRGLLFDKICADQKINEHLKSIALSVDITKPISSKSGRHTFATLYYLKTKDIYTLKEIMGHSDIRETLIYTHISYDTKQEGIAMFNSFKI